MPQFLPTIAQYDFDLGIDKDIIDYIQESHEIESRISSTPCYLFFQHHSGSAQGSEVSPLVVSSFVTDFSNARAIIWSSGSALMHPDLRPYSNDGDGSLYVKVDGVELTRVLEISDIEHDNEYAAVERLDLPDKRVEIVFNNGYDPTSHVVEYYYTAMNSGIYTETMKRGDNTDQSIFGWEQYFNDDADAYRRKHQILVRFPMVTGDLQINEEGKVSVEENLCWMTATPFVHDFDMLIILPQDSHDGEEKRMEIVNKQDSQIQGRLVSQRFNVKLLEASDPRYKIPLKTD